MSDEGAHEAVVSSLMDLQARLRGEVVDEPAGPVVTLTEPEAHSEATESASAPELVELPEAPAVPVDAVTVVEEDLSIHVAPEPAHAPAPAQESAEIPAPAPVVAPVVDIRLAAIAERLTRLESDLEGVLERIDAVDLGRAEDRSTSDFTDLQHAIDQRFRGSDS